MDSIIIGIEILVIIILIVLNGLLKLLLYPQEESGCKKSLTKGIKEHYLF